MNRVLIRTFPPQTNANYGGILQVWALASVLEQCGVVPVVDSGRAPVTRPASSKALGPVATRIAALARRARNLVRWIVAVLCPLSATSVRVASRLANEKLLSFASRRLELVDMRRADDTTIASLDGFVVGSDQVWRSAYMNVGANLFDSIAPTDPRPRFSYAASFGVGLKETMREYGDALISDTGPLAQRLHGVSVRERSGVEIALQLWGVEAEWHVDPTLLLTRNDYEKLAAEGRPICASGCLLDYVLDESQSARSVVDQVASVRGAPTSIMPPMPRNLREFRRNRSRYMKPSVEQWLGAFRDSGYVVTDSFHGTVFAIIFHTPFIAIVNHKRGAERFTSLLGRLGLSDRLLEPGDLVPLELIVDEIDWPAVDAIIESERARSFLYLRRMLEPILGKPAGSSAGELSIE